MFSQELVDATMQEFEREVAQLWHVAHPHEQAAFPRNDLFLERIKRFSLFSCMTRVFRTASAS